MRRRYVDDRIQFLFHCLVDFFFFKHYFFSLFPLLLVTIFQSCCNGWSITDRLTDAPLLSSLAFVAWFSVSFVFSFGFGKVQFTDGKECDAMKELYKSWKIMIIRTVSCKILWETRMKRITTGNCEALLVKICLFSIHRGLWEWKRGSSYSCQYESRGTSDKSTGWARGRQVAFRQIRGGTSQQCSPCWKTWKWSNRCCLTNWQCWVTSRSPWRV